MSVTHFKSKEGWSEDPMKSVETKVKSAFTRTFNQSGGRAKCNIAVDDFKRKRGRGKTAAAPGDDLQPVGELREASLLLWCAACSRVHVSAKVGILPHA